MKRVTAVAIAALTVAAVGAVPSQAAVKKKPAPIKGSYTVQLLPDPSYEVMGTAGDPGCSGLNPKGKDSHAFTVPAAGTLQVVLDSQDPTKGAAPVGLDWDLYLLDAGGAVLNEATGGTAHEETLDKFKVKTAVSIVVCNNIGAPDATVSYTFTYK